MHRDWSHRFGIAALALAAGSIGVGLTLASPSRTKLAQRRSVIPVELTSEGKEVVAGRVLLKLRRPLRADIAAILRHYGVVSSERVGGVDVLDMPPVAPPELLAAALATLQEVEYCEPDGVVRLDGAVDDPDASSQWHLATIRAAEAWDLSQGVSTVKIAVIDTGCDPSHPDLVEKILPGKNFLNGSADTTDDHGHGTHVCGIAGAATDNGQGVAGVGYRCSLLPLKALDSTGSGAYSGIAQAIRYAAAQGARVINLSLGGTAGSAMLREAVNDALAQGALVVAAAGNAGSSRPRFPAFYEGALSVGATTPSDDRASFSNFGSWVDVAAPGTSILSTFPVGNVTLGYSDSGYVTMSGTSMATPIVSGIAGLVFAELGSSATPAAVRAAIEATAHPSASVWTRFGRVDAAAALAVAANPSLLLRGTVRNLSMPEGRWRRGDLSSLEADDRSQLTIASTGPRGMRSVEIEVDVDGLSGALDQLSLSVLLHASAYVLQRISVFNWASGQFDVRDESSFRGPSTERTVDLSLAPSVYVQGGLVRLRIRMEAGAAFTAFFDCVSAKAVGR